MSTAIAPQQTERRQWHDQRVGRFTASTMGKLMAEPRSKAAKEAGEFSEGAKTLIAKKATERVKGAPIHTHADFSMRRGTLLEHAAIHLLSQHWKPIDACTYMAYRDNSGATPDGLVREPGTPTMDIKCKEDESMLLQYAASVPNNDFEALKAWDRDEAYQIATQAAAAGSTRAYLIYFTDKLPAIRIDDEQAETCNRIMEMIGEKLFTLTGQPHEYRLCMNDGEYGFAFVARWFDIPAEVVAIINKALDRAEVECVRMVGVFRDELSRSEEPQVEAEIEQLVDPVPNDRERFNAMVHHLKDFPEPIGLKSAIAQQSYMKIKQHVKAALDIAQGTLTKDLE